MESGLSVEVAEGDALAAVHGTGVDSTHGKHVIRGRCIITLARRLTHGGALAWIVALILFVLLLAQRLQFTKEIAAVERRMDSICRMNSYVSRSKNLTLKGRHFTIHHGDKHNCTYDAVDSLTCTEQVSVTPARAEGRRHLEPHDEDTAYVGLTRDSPLPEYHTMWLKISPARWWGQNVVGTRKVQGSTYLNFMDHEYLTEYNGAGWGQYNLAGYGEEQTALGICFDAHRNFYLENWSHNDENTANILVRLRSKASSIEHSTTGANCQWGPNVDPETCALSPGGWIRVWYKSDRGVEDWDSTMCEETSGQHLTRTDVDMNVDTLK